MAVCTFFGHRDCPESIKPRLRDVLMDLIINKGVDTFYVGNQGRFDGIVRGVLRELEKEYPEICYAVVLAYRATSGIAPYRTCTHRSRIKRVHTVLRNCATICFWRLSSP